jgi:hypothetical protein
MGKMVFIIGDGIVENGTNPRFFLNMVVRALNMIKEMSIPQNMIN